MNIVYLIGNGFDLNLGLKTKYSDFYDYYLQLDSPNDNVAKLKESIRKHKKTELWKDLEIALGQITKDYDNVDDFIEALLDISDHLLGYIRKEQERIYIDYDATKKLTQDIAFPNQYLPNAAKERIRNFQYKWRTSDWKIDIITYNYTNIIDKLLNEIINSDIGPHHSIYPIKLSSINHVHGLYNDTILLGVNNVEQIANEQFRTEKNLLEIFVKPMANNAMELLMDERCSNLINNATLIITFGLSFGPTDNIWWERLKNKIKKQNSRIIIFDYIKDFDMANNRRTLFGLYKRKASNLLFGEDAEALIEYIDYAISPEAFQLKEYIQEKKNVTYNLTA